MSLMSANRLQPLPSVQFGLKINTPTKLALGTLAGAAVFLGGARHLEGKATDSFVKTNCGTNPMPECIAEVKDQREPYDLTQEGLIGGLLGFVGGTAWAAATEEGKTTKNKKTHSK